MTKRTDKCKGLGLLAAALGLCLALLGVAKPALAENAVTAEVPFSYAVKGELAPKDAEATFKIVATDQGETLLPVSDTVTAKPGVFKFDLKGEVAQPGEHHYHVTQVAGSDKDWTYDAAEYDVTVYVGWENGVAGSTLSYIQVNFFDKSGSLDKVHSLLAKGVSIEQIIKDFTDYFRSLLLIRKGIKSENVLGEQVSSFPADIRGAFNEEQLEAALDMFLNLYRDIRYSLNPRFELELAISKLSKLRYVASTASIIEQLARLKNDLINGTITPLNPALADMKSVQPEARPTETATPAEPEPVSQPIQDIAPEASPEPEAAPASEPDEPEEKPVQPASPATDISILKDILPLGTVDAKNTDDGLVLTFDKKFYYQTAYRNLQSIRETIQTRLRSNVNVILAFSDNPNNVVSEDAPSTSAVQQESPKAEEKPAEEYSALTEGRRTDESF